MLHIKDLKVSIEGKEIVQGVTLDIVAGTTHALMGQNGSGKSTLAQTLMGNPSFEVISGSVTFAGKDLLAITPDQRAKAGIFLSFQYPSEVSGVGIASYLRMIYNKRYGLSVSPVKFRGILKEKLELLDLSQEFTTRYLNEGFSGGEKKRLEMLQMLVLEPNLAILDEVDSGLDIDALKIVSRSVSYLQEKNKMSVLLITHYKRILNYVKPDFIHIMKAGKIVKSGDFGLADELEEKGYKNF